MEELKRTLSTIAEHVSSLIKDAEDRAKDGDSPNPTARGGLGTFSTTGTPTLATAAPTLASARGVSRGPPPPPPSPPPPPPPSTMKTATSSATAADYDQVDSSKHGDDLVVVKPQTFAVATGGGGGSGRDRGAMPRLEVSSAEKSAGGSAVPAGAVDTPGKSSPVEVPARTRVLRRVSSVRALFLGVANKGERLEKFARQMGLPHDTVVAHVQVRHRPCTYDIVAVCSGQAINHTTNTSTHLATCVHYYLYLYRVSCRVDFFVGWLRCCQSPSVCIGNGSCRFLLSSSPVN